MDPIVVANEQTNHKANMQRTHTLSPFAQEKTPGSSNASLSDISTFQLPVALIEATGCAEVSGREIQFLCFYAMVILIGLLPLFFDVRKILSAISIISIK